MWLRAPLWAALMAVVLLAAPAGGAAGPAAAAPVPAPSPPPPPAAAADLDRVAWLSHLPTPSPAAGLAFLHYPDGDVLFADGVFGLMAWSLADPAHPRLLGTLPAAALAQPGDRRDAGFWEGEHLQVDQRRSLVLLARDAAAFGSGVAGLYLVDARDPRRLRVLAFHQEPAGHTVQCLDGCRYLWDAGRKGAWVTDLADPARPATLPGQVDDARNDGAPDYVHDTDVDGAGVAWISGAGGVRGYWVSGLHVDPLTGASRRATPAAPVPYAGGKFVSPNDERFTFAHDSWRPMRALGGFPAGGLLLVADEDFGPGCEDSGQLLVVSLAGSLHGEGWRSTPEQPFRLQVVGSWGPAGSPGLQTADAPGRVPGGGACSAHWLDPLPGVGDGSIVAEAFYAQGVRFLDVRDPRHPTQVGYFVPRGTVAAAPAFHRGLVYVAQYSGGVDVIRFTPR
jgi:hypothetical protein